MNAKMTGMTNVLPNVEIDWDRTPPAPPPMGFTCPSWCTVDHTSAAGLRFGHVVHEAGIAAGNGTLFDYWHAVVGTWRVLSEPVKVSLPIRISASFDDPDGLRRFAAEFHKDLLEAADTLERFNAEATA